MPKKVIVSGDYYEHDARDGSLREVAPRVPDVVACRRVRDFDAGLPLGAAVTACTRCGCAVAFNPDAPHQDRPRVCVQCLDIQPLPMRMPES